MGAMHDLYGLSEAGEYNAFDGEQGDLEARPEPIRMEWIGGGNSRRVEPQYGGSAHAGLMGAAFDLWWHLWVSGSQHRLPGNATEPVEPYEFPSDAGKPRRVPSDYFLHVTYSLEVRKGYIRPSDVRRWARTGSVGQGVDGLYDRFELGSHGLTRVWNLS